MKNKVDEPTAGTTVLMISNGEPKDNRGEVKDFGLTFPIAAQQQWEISRLYTMFAAPVVYLIDDSGMIARDVAAGTDAIFSLMAAIDGVPSNERPAAAQTQVGVREG